VVIVKRSEVIVGLRELMRYSEAGLAACSESELRNGYKREIEVYREAIRYLEESERLGVDS